MFQKEANGIPYLKRTVQNPFAEINRRITKKLMSWKSNNRVLVVCKNVQKGKLTSLDAQYYDLIELSKIS